MATNAQWAQAFCDQAAADLAVGRMLEESAFPRCHALHQLQMATEKVAKAYRLAHEPDATPQNITKHKLGNFVEAYFRSPKAVERLGLGRHDVTHAKRKLAALSSEMEGLAPTSDLSKRNAEYPWEVGGVVLVPARHAYAELDARLPRMVDFMKFLTVAISDFEAKPELC